MPRVSNLSSTKLLTPNWDNIPTELIKYQRWVCWKIARGTKVPFDARQTNSHASVNKPESWCSYVEAKEAYIQRFNEPDRFDGVGIVLTGDGLVAVDLDHCIEQGHPNSQALEILKIIGSTYVEISPSGRGIRAFAFATPLEKGLKANFRSVSIELYSTLRYLTVTGHAISQNPISHSEGFNLLANQIKEFRKNASHLDSSTHQ